MHLLHLHFLTLPVHCSLCFSGNLMPSHTPCGRAREKNAPCRDNKGYLKCDTAFQRMGGGGKRREKGIVERR